MRRRVALALLVGSCTAAGAQGGSAKIEFHLLRPGLAVPEYTFVLMETGVGTYKAKGQVVKASTNKYSVIAQAEPTETVQELAVNRLGVEKAFALVRATGGLKGCASKAKVADTGAKRLVFDEVGKAEVSCFYNYSESKPVAELTALFQAMAFTLDVARKMEGEQRFDRLGLDGEMTMLAEAVKDGQAAGLSNIRGTLQGLVDDPAVLERVRVQAGKLLEQSLVTP